MRLDRSRGTHWPRRPALSKLVWTRSTAQALSLSEDREFLQVPDSKWSTLPYCCVTLFRHSCFGIAPRFLRVFRAWSGSWRSQCQVRYMKCRTAKRIRDCTNSIFSRYRWSWRRWIGVRGRWRARPSSTSSSWAWSSAAWKRCNTQMPWSWRHPWKSVNSPTDPNDY